MHPSHVINAIFLCLLNVSFLVAGFILNSVVIISLWRSSTLINKKNLCYFMILILSCSDLAVVAMVHPLLILSTIRWSLQMYKAEYETIRLYATIFLASFSMFALLTLNIERFLAITRPFFHQTMVSKGKLALFLAFQIIIADALTPLYYGNRLYRYIKIPVVLLLFLLVFTLLNYKILVIAKAKRKEEFRVAPTGLAKAGSQGTQNIKRKRNLKNISTCLLAVCCFFFCSLPAIGISIWVNISNPPTEDRQAILFDIWASTFFSMNSTFNSLIFFWKNSTLRREGMKIVNNCGLTDRNNLT